MSSDVEFNPKPTEDLTAADLAAMTDYEKAVRGIIYSPEIYDLEWFEKQEWQHPWIERLMGWLVGSLGPFESSLDLGAGDGYYSYVLGQMGTEVYAIEISDDACSVMHETVNCAVHDLREPLRLKRTFDLVLCLEVAEHLPESAANTLCETMGRHCGKIAVFTHAPPKQGGHGHCNCQPADYWMARLVVNGLSLSERWTEHTRKAFKAILGKELPWLQKNIMVLWKRNGYLP